MTSKSVLNIVGADMIAPPDSATGQQPPIGTSVASGDTMSCFYHSRNNVPWEDPIQYHPSFFPRQRMPAMIVEGAGNFRGVIEDKRPFPLFAFNDILKFSQLLADMILFTSISMSLLALFILIMLPLILLLSHGTGPHEPNFGLEPILASL
jgi:hypothetical protein